MLPQTALLALLLAQAPVPRAPAAPRVAILAVGLDAPSEEQVPRFERALRDAVAASRRLTPLPPGALLGPSAARGEAEHLARAKKALADAAQAYGDLDTVRSLRRADDAIRELEATDLAVTFDQLVEAWVLRLASRVANGDRDVDRELESLLVLKPSLHLPPAYFTPEQILRAKRLRGHLARGAPLEVVTEPPGADVWVDGKLRGISPVRVADLPPGAHYVTARATGHRMAQERTGKASVTLKLRPGDLFPALDGARKAIAASPEDSRRDEAARRFAAATGAAQVVLAVARKSPAGERLEYELFRIDASDGHNLGHVAGVAGVEAVEPAVRSAAKQVLERDAPREGGMPSTHFAPAFTWTHRTTGYSLMGGGAALAATGVLLGLQAMALQARHSATPQVQAAPLAQEGRLFAVSADVCVLVGLATAGAGAWLGFFAPAPAPAPAPTPAPAPAPRRPAVDLPMPPPPPSRASDPKPPPAPDDDLRNY